MALLTRGTKLRRVFGSGDRRNSDVPGRQYRAEVDASVMRMVDTPRHHRNLSRFPSPTFGNGTVVIRVDTLPTTASTQRLTHSWRQSPLSGLSLAPTVSSATVRYTIKIAGLRRKLIC